MNLDDLTKKFSSSTENQRKAIFSTLFIAGNKLKKGFITIQQSPHDTRAMCICPTEKVNDFYVNDFSEYQEELKYLFEVYTDKEIETLFTLLSKLYAGIENLEKRVADNKKR